MQGNNYFLDQKSTQSIGENPPPRGYHQISYDPRSISEVNHPSY